MMSDTEQEQRIRVSEETWRRLNALKTPGDTFDDVAARLLDNTDLDIDLE